MRCFPVWRLQYTQTHIKCEQAPSVSFSPGPSSCSMLFGVEGRLAGSSGGCHREDLLSLLVGSLPLHRVLSEQSSTFSTTLWAPALCRAPRSTTGNPSALWSLSSRTARTSRSERVTLNPALSIQTSGFEQFHYSSYPDELCNVPAITKTLYSSLFTLLYA